MRKFNTRRLLVDAVIVIVLVGLGVLVGWLIADGQNTKDKYSLLDPSINKSNQQLRLVNFDPLRQDIKKYLAGLSISHSFYFEYLPNGINIRNGEDKESVAASLLKTPVVMDLYKLAEIGKLKLDNTVMIARDDISSDSVYGNQYNLKAGDTISLRNAAKLALQGSDNTAIDIVRKQVQPLVTRDSDVFESLDITYSETVDSTGNPNKVLSISARSYSSMLKCLYYSCFLEPKDSEEILYNLIGSSDPNKLVAGVNKDVKVAHKIGSGLSADSDCGIFYVPNKQYLICLMFWGKGTNMPGDTDPYFQKVSKMVYDYVAKSN